MWSYSRSALEKYLHITKGDLPKIEETSQNLVHTGIYRYGKHSTVNELCLFLTLIRVCGNLGLIFRWINLEIADFELSLITGKSEEQRTIIHFFFINSTMHSTVDLALDLVVVF